MGKKMTSKHFAIKRTSFGAVNTVDFKPNIPNKTKVAPEIDEHYVNDSGEVIFILTNGNEISQTNFELHWGKSKKVIV